MSKTTHATLEGVRTLLQGAIQLEHATLPPYLCALYSIIPGSNPECVEIIKSVFVEEMLHMALAANVLNAIGGSPVIDGVDFMVRYPTSLPNSDNSFVVPLARFSPSTIETFMRIEKPEEIDSPSEAEGFETIGQFYRAIEDGLVDLCAHTSEADVFCGDPTRQITPDMLDYDGSGRIVVVLDLASALEAINEIEEQGEGLKHAEVWDGDRDMFHPDRDEVAHYFRFVEVMNGRFFRRGDTPQSGPTGEAFAVDWGAVYPMRENPRSEDYPDDSPVRDKMLEFNLAYRDVLRTLHRAFNGEPARLVAAVSQMMEIRDRARELMQLPTGVDASTAGPTFEYATSSKVTGSATPHLRISVRRDGPYIVEGGVPLVRKSAVVSEGGEPLTWRKESSIEVDEGYRLCRCGQSSHKPFCDGTHSRVRFDGDETAPIEPSVDRRTRLVGTTITLTDDRLLCQSAGFCENLVDSVWDMVERTDDIQVRFQLMHMVEQCPSGRLVYELADGPLEPDVPREVSVTKDGPYWVTGEIDVILSDGRTLETRNRVTLCRCGQSSNKPLCDGTHKRINFRDG